MAPLRKLLMARRSVVRSGVGCCPARVACSNQFTVKHIKPRRVRELRTDPDRPKPAIVQGGAFYRVFRGDQDGLGVK